MTSGCPCLDPVTTGVSPPGSPAPMGKSPAISAVAVHLLLPSAERKCNFSDDVSQPKCQPGEGWVTFSCKDRNIFILKNESSHCFVQLIRKKLGMAASLEDMDDLP